MNEDRVVFYCISDKGPMLQELLRSLKTLNRFIDPENVLVCITPPHREELFYHEKIGHYANIQFKENLTEPFWADRASYARYGEMLYFTEVDARDIICLDHDTYVMGNIFELFEGDYDVAIRVAGNFNSCYDMAEWEAYFKRYGKTPIPMPNCGLVIFKNYTHKKIASEIMEVFNDLDMVMGDKGCQNRDEIALAVACSGYKIRWLTKYEHCFRWNYEVSIRKNPYVIHGELNRSMIKNYLVLNLRAINSFLFPLFKGKLNWRRENKNAK